MKRRNKSRAQVSVEYLMIVGFAFMILIPAIYLFFSSSQKASEQITNSRLNSIGQDIMVASDQMYYAGGNSKITLNVDMPAGVNDVETFCVGKTSTGSIVNITNVSSIPPSVSKDIACELIFRTGTEEDPSEMVFLVDNVLINETLAPNYYSQGLKQITIKSKGDYVSIEGYSS
jgi:hypothetical protein